VARLNPTGLTRQYKTRYGQVFHRIDDPTREDDGWHLVSAEQLDYLRSLRHGAGSIAPGLFEIRLQSDAISAVRKQRAQASRGSPNRPIGALEDGLDDFAESTREKSEHEAELLAIIDEQKTAINKQHRAMDEMREMFEGMKDLVRPILAANAAAAKNTASDSGSAIADPNTPNVQPAVVAAGGPPAPSGRAKPFQPKPRQGADDASAPKADD
jgi:hypothetical protein